MFNLSLREGYYEQRYAEAAKEIARLKARLAKLDPVCRVCQCLLHVPENFNICEDCSYKNEEEETDE